MELKGGWWQRAKGWDVPASVSELCFPADCALCLCRINPGVRFDFTALAGTDLLGGSE